MPRDPVVHDEERFKAQFIADYERLCKRYGLVIIHIELEGYAPYGIAILQDKFLSQQLEEMRLEPTSIIKG